jgi:hypothetical protein
MKVHSMVLELLQADGQTDKVKLIVFVTLDASSPNNDSSCDFPTHLAVCVEFLDIAGYSLKPFKSEACLNIPEFGSYLQQNSPHKHYKV